MRLVVLLWCVLCSNFIFGQNVLKQISFRNLTVEDGLSQNSVVSIAQDSIGYMWFATQDGLNKYDGRNFTVYNKQFEDVTSPNFSKLGKVYLDKSNKLWIITNSGRLEVFNEADDDFESINNVSNISLVFQDKKFNTYLGTFGQGLYKIDAITKDTIQVFRNENKKRTIYDIIEASDHLWIATSDGILKLNTEGYKELGVHNISNINFSSLAKTDNDRIWMGTFGHGLFFKEKGNDNIRRVSNLPEDLNIQDILVDQKNRTWITTYGRGVYLISSDDTSIQHFTANKNSPYALHYNDVLSIYEDYTGTIWFGTDGAGLSYYDEHLAKFNLLTNNQLPGTISVDVIRAISVEGDDIFLGTSGKGLTRINFEKEDFITYTTSNSKISSNRVMSLCQDTNKLWVGHQGAGLDVLMDSDAAFKSFPSLSKMTIWKIIKASEAAVWLATRENGLLLFHEVKGIVKQFNTNNSNLKSNNIRTIEKGVDGILWIGTDDLGLFKLNTLSNEVESIDGITDKIKSLNFEGKTLWVGTNGNGLKKYNIPTETIQQFTTEDGLPNNVIYGILKGEKDDIWLSSNRGITQLMVEDFDNINVINYGNYDGLQAFEFNTGAYFKDHSKNLYFGGLEGLNWFNPEQLTFNSVEPKTIITKLQVFNKERVLEPNLNLKHNENTITFTFSGLHFSQPERNLYKYKLVNNDEDWIASGNTNLAHYTNLPPDDYQFQVLSSNYDGVWDSTPATYHFSVLKPWYATHFAIVIYGLLVVLLIIAIYKYLKFRWQVKTQLQLEHAETERLKKLDEFKTKLYTNISHEFRTPLTLISGPIDKQLDRQNLSKNDEKDLGLVKQNANRLLNLVNQMLDLSLIDSGQLRLKVSKGNLSVLVKQIIAAFQYKSKEKSIKFRCKIETIKSAYYDPDLIEKIVSNLLSNAIKYAPINSEIKVDVSKQEGVIVLSVINAYSDVKRKNLNKLFQRFYQDNEASDGVGVGLALVKELVTLSKGTVIANTIEEDKIQFSVTLPISIEAFSENDFTINENSVANIDKKNVTSLRKDAPVLLIVEDEKDIRDFIASIFKSNYRVLVAKDGKLGIDLAVGQLPDLIISDIMMPVKNGIELCNAIKHNPVTSHIPLILLTAKAGEEDEIEGLKTGADAYITKPFGTKKLIARVEQLLESRKQLQLHYGKTFNLNPDLAVTSTETEFLKKLQNVLDKHVVSDNFSTEKFSELLLMSRTQLHRKLKAITGMSTSEFIRSQRVKIASELLKKSDNTINEVAYKVGFKSPSYFIKCFRLQFNCTPSEYQNQ